MSDYDALVNPSNTSIPPFREDIADLPPFTDLPAVYDVLMTSEMREKGFSPCWGMGAWAPDVGEWIFSKNECNYLAGPNSFYDLKSEFRAKYPGKGICVKTAGRQICKRDIVEKQVPEGTQGSYFRDRKYFERQQPEYRFLRARNGLWGNYCNNWRGDDWSVLDESCRERTVEKTVREWFKKVLSDKEVCRETTQFAYSWECATKAIFGQDRRRDMAALEAANLEEASRKEREEFVLKNLTSCYYAGTTAIDGMSLIYTREECEDVLLGTFIEGKCVDPFNKPIAAGGTGCADIEAITTYKNNKEKISVEALAKDPNYKKGAVAFADVIPQALRDRLSNFWYRSGDAFNSVRQAEEYLRYNLGTTDEDIQNYKNLHPELVLWTPPPPPPTADEIAEKRIAEMKKVYPGLYERTTRLREPRKQFKYMPNLISFDSNNKKIGDGVMGHELDADEEALYQELKSMTKDQIISRGGLVKYFGLFPDFGGPDPFKYESRAQVNKDAFFGNPSTCELLGDENTTQLVWGVAKPICLGRIMPIPGSYNGGERAPRLNTLFFEYPFSSDKVQGPDGEERGIYGVPGNYSYEFYYRLHSQRLFVSEMELQDYNKRNNIVKLPPPPEPAPVITPPPPTPLEEAKALLKPYIETPPVRPPGPPQTDEEYLRQAERQLNNLDKATNDFTYYAVVGVIGIAAYFLVK
jgi:hypothetical protein